MDAIVQGAMLGGLYALYAAGLSLMFGVMRLVNIAHGDFIVLAAFVAIAAAPGLQASPFFTLALVPLLMFGVGYGLQRGVLNLTLGKGQLPPLLVTFGLSIVIQNALLEAFSADTRALPARGVETLTIGLPAGLAVGVLPLATLALAILVTFALEWLFGRTAVGRGFRATSDDLEIARLMGIDDRRIYGLATAIAFAVIGVAGVLLAMRTTVSPTDGPNQLLYAFEAVIIGGLGSFWGTFAGAILLGIAQSIGFRINPGWGALIGHLVFIVILVFKPSGLFERTRD
jgi:branched-chain amino acid transport system permease protein